MVLVYFYFLFNLFFSKFLYFLFVYLLLTENAKISESEILKNILKFFGIIFQLTQANLLELFTVGTSALKN